MGIDNLALWHYKKIIVFSLVKNKTFIIYMFINTETKKSYIYLIKWVTLAIISGILGSVIVKTFTLLLESINSIISSTNLPLVIWPIVGALLTGGIIYVIEPGAAGEGIPSYLRGLNQNKARLDLRETFFKYFAALFTLSTYGNGGIIGPLGRVISGVMSFIGDKLKFLRFTDFDRRTATICGMAATIGAVFHSAIGGGVFAVEIIQKTEMRYRDLFPAILSSTLAVYFCKLNNWPSFYSIKAVNEFMDLQMLFWVLLVALCAGFTGKLYIYLYNSIARLIKREQQKNRLFKVLIGSAIAAFFAWIINPQLLGTSKSIIVSIFKQDNSILIGNLEGLKPLFLILLILMIIKAFANCLTVGTGMSAGFTGPSVIIGLLLGMVFTNLLGIENNSANYYALLAAGFSAMLGSSINIPLAAAILTIETFGLQYSLAAGLAAIIGFQVNRHYTLYDYAQKSAKLFDNK